MQSGACSVDVEDDWLFLDGLNDLSKLVKKYCQHLGKD